MQTVWTQIRTDGKKRVNFEIKKKASRRQRSSGIIIGVQWGYSQGTVRVQSGYSTGTEKVNFEKKPANANDHRVYI